MEESIDAAECVPGLSRESVDSTFVDLFATLEYFASGKEDFAGAWGDGLITVLTLNETLVNRVGARENVVGLVRESVNLAVVDQGTALELVFTNDLNGSCGRGNGGITVVASDDTSVNGIDARLGVLGFVVILEGKTQLNNDARLARGRTSPTGFFVASRRASVATDLVSIVASLGTRSDTITANGNARSTRGRAGITFGNNALVATISSNVVSVVALFLSNLQTITTNFFAASEDGGTSEDSRAAKSSGRSLDGGPTNRASTLASVNSDRSGIGTSGGLGGSHVNTLVDSALAKIGTSREGNRANDGDYRVAWGLSEISVDASDSTLVNTVRALKDVSTVRVGETHIDEIASLEFGLSRKSGYVLSRSFGMVTSSTSDGTAVFTLDTGDGVLGFS